MLSHIKIPEEIIFKRVDLSMFEKTLREGAKTIFYEVGGGGVFNSMSSWKYAGVFQQQQQQQKQKTKVDVLKFKNMQRCL